MWVLGHPSLPPLILVDVSGQGCFCSQSLALSFLPDPEAGSSTPPPPVGDLWPAPPRLQPRPHGGSCFCSPLPESARSTRGGSGRHWRRGCQLRGPGPCGPVIGRGPGQILLSLPTLHCSLTAESGQAGAQRTEPGHPSGLTRSGQAHSPCPLPSKVRGGITPLPVPWFEAEIKAFPDSRHTW